MSAEALNHVDKLRTAPDGQKVTAGEKGVLHVLANAHNTKERAAFLRVSTIGSILNLSPRRVRELLNSCMAKGILWRQQRFVRGQQVSNYWKFTGIDGKETKAARLASERLAERGRKGQGLRKSTVSTAVHRGDCEIPQTPTAKSRRPPLRDSAPLGLRDPADQDPVLDPVLEPKLEPVLAKPAAGVVDFLEEAKRLQRKLQQRRQAVGVGRRGMASAAGDLGEMLVKIAAGSQGNA